MRELIAQVPAIRRARGWRLYTENGLRILDFYQDEGRGIMGWKADGATRLAKALLDKGLTAPYPSMWQKRLEKAVLAWKQAYAAVMIFDTEPEAEQVLNQLSCIVEQELNKATAFSHLEMPFSEYLPAEQQGRTGNESEKMVALVRLPLPRSIAPGIVLLAKQAVQLLREYNQVQQHAPVAAFKLGAAVKSLQSFERFQAYYNEKLWEKVDPYIEKLFSRTGPWLFPEYSTSEHERVFLDCLEKGILISPNHDIPSLIPGEFDLGEIKVLAEIARQLT